MIVKTKFYSDMNKNTETSFMDFGQNLINCHGHSKIILICGKIL